MAEGGQVRSGGEKRVLKASRVGAAASLSSAKDTEPSGGNGNRAQEDGDRDGDSEDEFEDAFEELDKLSLGDSMDIPDVSAVVEALLPSFREMLAQKGF